MARRGSAIYVSPARFRSVNGVLTFQRKVAALPDALVAKVKPALEKGADDFVAKVKAIAPGDELETHPGQLRDGVHREPGDTELSVVVAVDARDAQGRQYPKHVDSGHKAADGSHVPAKPFFWVAYSLVKKSIRSRVRRAMTAGIKEVMASGGTGSNQP